MIEFRNYYTDKDFWQFELIPTLTLFKDDNEITLSIGWMTFVVNFRLFR